MKGKLGLRPGGPVGEGVAAFASDILREGRAAIDDPDKTDAVAVHDFRKAMKRWRALLRMLEPLVGPDARRLRHQARDLARALADVRDRQAALDAAADLEKCSHQIPQRSWDAIRRRLQQLRENAETLTLTDAMRERLRDEIEAGGRAVDQWALSDLQFWQVADGLTQAYARIRNALPSAWTECDDETLHGVRQRIVVHRYQMPLIEPLWPRFVKVWVSDTQRLRERLGAHQDLTVLAALTAADQPLAPWRSRLVPLIEERKRTHVEAAARLSGRLFAERPKAFRRRLQALWDGAAQTAD